MKDWLKRSQFLLAIARSRHALLGDYRRLRWKRISRRAIRDYLAENNCRKLHVGSGLNILPGWLNSDITPAQEGIIYMDATRRFPLQSSSFDYVFSEHMIEHVSYGDAMLMLRECYRILKPGGRIRIATPDLSVLIGLYSNDKTSMQERYIEWIVENCIPYADHCKDVFVINNAFRAWGHQFLFDRKILESTLYRCGFRDLQFYNPGVSNDENLRNLEAHGEHIEDEGINQFETQVWEGMKV